MTRRRLNWYDEMHHISYLAIEGGSRMFTKSEAFYDAIYGTMKDYAVEAQQIHTLIQQYKQSSGTTLLDVACGTGRHLPFLREHYTLEGLDLDEQMLAIARQRNPEVVFHHADMADFDLGRRFDAIVCLFSSIGYVKTLHRLQQTLQTMQRHLHPGGLVIIEPWLTPPLYQAGHIGAVFVDQPDLKIARMNISEVADGISVMNFHYLVATPAGIEHFTERHELGLFSHEDYLGAFQASGLDVVHDPDPEKLTGRGVYLGLHH
jgi:ubiquinone/menaquinone biosynthesis C-methylase UbiE